MPDNSAAMAALLMSQQGRPAQQYDPFARQRRYAEALMTQGSSTAPVQSPLEGVARALTGGVGGFFAGQADREETDRRRSTTAGLLEYANAKTPEEQKAAQAKLQDADPNIVGAIAAQLISQRMSSERGAAQFGAMGGLGGQPTASGGSVGGGQPGPLTIDINKLPPPNQSVAPGGFSNNLGNIRTGVGFPGEGAPQNGFATFGTPQQGANAMVQNLGAYAQQNPNITVAQAIAKWAPPNENNTQQYISQVAEGTGINPGMPLGEVMKDPAVAAQLLDAITRKEKGGLPQGVTADTFMAATGGQPQAAPQAPVQLAQGGGEQQPPMQPPAAPQVAQAPQQAAAPAATTTPQISPQAAQLDQMAQRLAAAGSMDEAKGMRLKAQEVQAAYAAERSKTADSRAFDQAEFDRKNAIENAQKPPQEFQARSGTYADRMIQHNATLDKLDTQGATQKGRLLDATVLGVGVPGANYAQTPEYRQFKAAKDNWIAANLRQESGAAIGAKEYDDADKQYFPQPGDDPKTIANKRALRETATQAMVRSAGDKYKPDVGKLTGGAPPTGVPQVGAVIDGYRFKGGDPGSQQNWERAQ